MGERIYSSQNAIERVVEQGHAALEDLFAQYPGIYSVSDPGYRLEAIEGLRQFGVVLQANPNLFDAVAQDLDTAMEAYPRHAFAAVIENGPVVLLLTPDGIQGYSAAQVCVRRAIREAKPVMQQRAGDCSYQLIAAEGGMPTRMLEWMDETNRLPNSIDKPTIIGYDVDAGGVIVQGANTVNETFRFRVVNGQMEPFPFQIR